MDSRWNATGRDPTLYFGFNSATLYEIDDRAEGDRDRLTELRRKGNRWVDPTWCFGNLAETMRGCADGTQQSNDKN